MKAAVLTALGPAASSFTIENRPIPTPQPGQVLIRVKAFGLNHSELATRLGEPNPLGNVALPRVLGIECVGLVEAAPGSEDNLPVGSVVMAALGGMGRAFDGGYAEYCVVPKAIVIVVAASESELKLDWAMLGALPEMLQTAHGSLFRSLKLKGGERLLIRGGTSSVGLAAIGLGKHAGATIVATTRSAGNEKMLLEAGADHVVIDQDGKIDEAVKAVVPGGVDKVLELVGAATLANSIRCLADGGTCCCVGTLGGQWGIQNFLPMLMVPIGRYLTSYGEQTFKKENAPWPELIKLVQDGTIRIKVGKVFHGIEGVIEAHEVMERDQAGGKLVVVV